MLTATRSIANVFGASVLLLGGASFSQAEENVTLKIQRTAEVFGAIHGHNIFVNGERVATVYTGGTAEVAFPPAKDGINTLTVGTTDTRYAEERSDAETFAAHAGAVVHLTVANFDPEGYSYPVAYTEIRVEKPGTPAPTSAALSVSLNEMPVEVVVASEVVKTPPGIKRTVKRTRTVEHAVALTDATTLSANGGIDLNVVSIGIKGEIEKTLSQSFRQSETIEQSIEIDGAVLPAVRLDWVERRRTGTATVTLNGAPVQVPFQFTLDLELRAEIPEPAAK